MTFKEMQSAYTSIDREDIKEYAGLFFNNLASKKGIEAYKNLYNDYPDYMREARSGDRYSLDWYLREAVNIEKSLTETKDQL